ncbi:putative holin-like toxin [Enterococcus sp. AZ072]
MHNTGNLTKGGAHLSAYETIQVILGFGTFTIALISLIVKLLKNDKK